VLLLLLLLSAHDRRSYRCGVGRQLSGGIVFGSFRHDFLKKIPIIAVALLE
jgi:hypothetical protein